MNREVVAEPPAHASPPTQGTSGPSLASGTSGTSSATGGAATLSPLTPLMRQYERVKRAHRDAILIFRLGDFYEMFYEDAEVGAVALDLTLTSRNNGKAKRVPLAGFPVKAAETYIGRLIAAGYKVAVCEQMEDPRSAKGIVKREVVEVVTPGALLDEALLDGMSGNFLAAVAAAGDRLGLAFADISTGELLLEEVALGEGAAELARMSPAEVLVPASWCDDRPVHRARLGELARPQSPLAALCSTGREPSSDSASPAGMPATVRDDGLFDPTAARERLLEHLGTVTLAGFGIPDDSPAATAAGAALAYLTEIQPQAVRTLASPRWLGRESWLLLDDSTLRNLEVFRPLSQQPAGGGGAGVRGEGRAGSLLGAIDATLTAPGARLLREWLLRPPKERQAILDRQDAVAFLRDRGEVRGSLRDRLRGVADVPRVVGRCVAGRASPRDVGALRSALRRVPEIVETLGGSPGVNGADGCVNGADGPAWPLAAGLPSLVARRLRDLDGFSDLARDLGRALVDEPPAALDGSHVIRSGYDEELEALREARSSGHAWIAALQQRERVRTRIGSLKVGFNRVFGYFIEVTKPNLAQVPPDYQRKQTVANGERFVTPELKEMEARVLGAEERIGKLEAELFGRLRERVARDAPALQRMSEALATLDVLAGFAETAAERGYCQPEILEEPVLEIRGGRHPVVEASETLGRFVPNDVALEGDRRLMVLTGPNMAGKSTYLRQVGLIALLAHVGSFVPADSARVGLADRIFTRVGASDDLSRGRSTFLVEMIETANILRNAGPRSLVLLDEIGRGTATFDGLSLAWAVTEALHETEGGAPRTIFATHYHELTELASLLPRVFNAHAQVREWGDEIVFLRKVADGKSDRSYGIQVARLAGIPDPVVTRAREILTNLESGEFSATGTPRRSRGRSAPPAPAHDQISIFEPMADPLRDELRTIDVNGMRPLEALNLLAEWKRRYADASAPAESVADLSSPADQVNRPSVVSPKSHSLC